VRPARGRRRHGARRRARESGVLRDGRLRRAARRGGPDREGPGDASVAQFPFNIGYLGAKTLWAVVEGKPVAKNVDTGTALVTKANAKKFGG